MKEKKMRYLISSIMVFAILVTSLQATEYYISSSGDDSNPGNSEQPWKTLIKVNAHSFQPGDVIYFERGSKYHGGLFIDDSGNSEKPITFTAYGVGRSPYIDNRNHDFQNGNAIQVAGSYTIIDGFYFKDGLPANSQKGVGARRSGSIFINEGANHNIVRNCEIDNCPMGIQVYGEYNLITQNYIHDCNIFLAYPLWGPVGIMVATSHNEISYNHIRNYKSIGGAFDADGGALEIDESSIPKTDISIHHNYSVDNEGFLEIIGGVEIKNVHVHHNISEDFQDFIFFWAGTDCIVEHNTVLSIKPQNSRLSVVFSFHQDSTVTIRNNIFILANGLQVFAGDSVYEANKYDQYHYNNIYHCIDGSVEDPVGKPLGKGEKIADPLFLDFDRRDLHLIPGSPAVNAGAKGKTQWDYEGNKISIGKAPDIGAYEYTGNLVNSKVPKQ
jgi:hypothetical protein